jgi:hypothetical protein
MSVTHSDLRAEHQVKEAIDALHRLLQSDVRWMLKRVETDDLDKPGISKLDLHCLLAAADAWTATRNERVCRGEYR